MRIPRRKPFGLKHKLKEKEKREAKGRRLFRWLFPKRGGPDIETYHVCGGTEQ